MADLEHKAGAIAATRRRLCTGARTRALLLGLPDDVWQLITPLLSLRDLGRLSRVSRKAYTIGADDCRTLPLTNYRACRLWAARLPRARLRLRLTWRDPDMEPRTTALVAAGAVDELCLKSPPNRRGLPSPTDIPIPEFASLATVHKVHIEPAKFAVCPPWLVGVHTVGLYACHRLTDVHALAGAHTVTLWDCDRVKDFAPLAGVHDLTLYARHGWRTESPTLSCTSLGNITRLYICGYDVADVACLARVHTLTLASVQTPLDMSLLARVHTLNVHGCSQLRNVSALGDVHDLNLSFSNASDVSALGRVHRLNISGCDLVTDISSLRNVPELYLDNYEQGADLAPLGNHRLLSLEDSPVSDVSSLGGVHTLWLGDTLVTDVSALRRVRVLNLCFTPVEDVSALAHARELNLWGCHHVSDVSALGGVTHLNLSECPLVTDVSALGRVTSLLLTRCAGVSDVSALGRVRLLFLSGCTGVVDVSALAHVRTLSLAGCSGVTDLSPLTDVRVLDISATRHAPPTLPDMTVFQSCRIVPEKVHYVDWEWDRFRERVEDSHTHDEFSVNAFVRQLDRDTRDELDLFFGCFEVYECV